MDVHETLGLDFSCHMSLYRVDIKVMLTSLTELEVVFPPHFSGRVCEVLALFLPRLIGNI